MQMSVNGELVFRTSAGNRVTNVVGYVSNWMQLHPQGQIHIGADSKKRGARTKYSVSICLWERNYGVHEIHHTEILKNYPDDFSRLWEEVQRAVNIASSLTGVSANIRVHVDLNNDPKYFSNKLYEASMGFISSFGFQAIGKPDAWAASAGAHKYCQ